MFLLYLLNRGLRPEFTVFLSRIKPVGDTPILPQERKVRGIFSLSAAANIHPARAQAGGKKILGGIR